MSEGTLPLGILKQAIMKLDSVQSDMQEIREDADVSSDDKEAITKVAEMASVLEASLINIVRRECDEDEFLSENIDMDPIDIFPGDEIMEGNEDILDENI